MDSNLPSNKSKSAIPSCPKCDLNKAQFMKTMQNYQKAYRKKVFVLLEHEYYIGPLILLAGRWRGSRPN